MELTAELVRQHVKYDPDTGIFTRLIASGYRGCHKVGTVIGSSNGCGYRETTLLGRRVLLHRLAVLYMTGNWPTEDVDHKDGNRSNNKWDNLREICHRWNLQNQRKARKDSSTGLLGASYESRTGKFVARITVEGKYLCVGRFSTAIEAHEAYVKAKRELHAGNTI